MWSWTEECRAKAWGPKVAVGGNSEIPPTHRYNGNAFFNGQEDTGLPWGDLCEQQVSTGPSLALGTLPGSPFLTQALDPQRLKVLMAYHQEVPQVLHDGGEVGQQGGLGSRS